MVHPTKHRRKKAPPERINLEEWGNAGALDGLLSFLNIAPEQAPINQGARKVLNLLQQRGKVEPLTTETGTVSETNTVSISDTLPVIDPPLLGEAQTSHADEKTGVPALQSTSLSVIDTVPNIAKTGTLSVTDKPDWTHTKQATGFGNKKLYHCTLAQDGHSHTEEALYQLLWRSGKSETEDTRLTVMGYGEMSKRVRLSFNNTKAACHRLIAKLALEEAAREVSDKRQGKTYRVFSYKAILERRRACGMEWVIRNKGVEFVSKESEARASISGTLPDIDAVSETAPPTVSIKARGSGSVTGTLLENSFRTDFRESSSVADLASIVQALADYGQPDDDIAQLLVQRCQTVAADCTVDEIIHFVHEKGLLVRHDPNRRITNPMGFLVTAVPKCLIGETFQLYRRQERERLEHERMVRERQQAEIEQWRKEQEAILNDPNASEEDKRFAQQVLNPTDSL